MDASFPGWFSERLPGPLGDKPRCRVLVVDDNHDGAISLALLLKIWGHEVATAHDGEAALTMALSFHPLVILLDLGLPQLDGLHVARRLRQQDSFRDTVLVAVTRHAHESARCKDAGFDYFLLKPIDPWEIREIIVAVRCEA